MPPKGRSVCGIGTGVVLLSALGTAGVAGDGRATGAKRAALPELVLVAPGTRVKDEPPRGWSHLVLKSIPRLESGDLDTLPSFASATATLFRSVILADVRPGPGGGAPYRLARVGLGLCVPAGGVDTVVIPDRAGEAPFALGMIERTVLDRAHAELKKARLVARAERFAVLASPSELRVEGRHEHVWLFYAFVTNPADGKIDVIVWTTTADPARKALLSSLTLLPPRLIERCGLDVRAERLLGALPVNWSFAMVAPPPGTPLDAPDSLRPWLLDPGRIAADVGRFEGAVRAVLARPRRPSAGG
jgi:hypothetical protein